LSGTKFTATSNRNVRRLLLPTPSWRPLSQN